MNKVEEVSDSVQIINYANSYSKRPMDIKMVKQNGEWKYSHLRVAMRMVADRPSTPTA